MFGQILRTHWVFTRHAVLVAAAFAFALPAFIWRIGAIGVGDPAPAAVAVVEGFAALGVVVAFSALLIGFVLAVVPWSVDQETRHVYPLALPIPFRNYVAMRFGAGALTLLLPTVALWLGALFILSQIELPAVLETYPGTLALRFLLAMLVSYAAVFALQHLANKRATLVVLVVVVVFAIVQGTLETMNLDNVSAAIFRALAEWPGPLSLFAEPWRLVDV